MTASSRWRGHRITCDGGEWRYADNDQPVAGNPRPCGFCDKPDTPEGHDPCLGTIPGIMNACCGHGEVSDAYVQFLGGHTVRGRRARDILTLMRD